MATTSIDSAIDGCADESGRKVSTSVGRDNGRLLFRASDYVNIVANALEMELAVSLDSNTSDSVHSLGKRTIVNL
jgi:hypothetical protein